MQKNKKVFIAIAAIFLVCWGFVIVHKAYVSAAEEPQGDRLVLESYLNQVAIPQLKTYIDEKVNELDKKIEDMKSGQSQSGDKFTVVSVKKGQKLMGGDGTELILRMGAGVIIATPKGGLADTTQGTDLANGTDVPPNHLLIVPLEDGRGFLATKDVLVMVKGKYSVE